VLLLLFQAETIQAQWTTNGNNINNTNSGNVGIGTTSPDKKLTVQGTIPSPGGAMTVLRTTGANNGYGLLLDATGTGNNNLGFSVNGAAKGGSAWDIPRSFLGFVNLGYSNNDFSLRLNSDGSLTYHDSVYPGPERFRITAAGNVGIGTSNPSAKLDVNGSINVSGNINAKYQDVAEWVNSPEVLAAGTVVVVDPTKSNQVTASNQPYDTRVAGVVSAQPGLALGEAGAGKLLVATTGRVRVKVDATPGPIQVGDLLVTSDKEGMAKRSEPLKIGGAQIHRPGTLIGKALEPLEKGSGEILVLLSLQ